MSVTRVRMTSRSSLSDDSSADEAFAGCRARAHRFELAGQPLVLLGRTRLLRLHPIDHIDEPLDLFLESIDRFEFRTCRGLSHTTDP